MTAMAAVCGVLIVLLGFWSTGRTPTDTQSAIQITCLVGGLILCFVAVLLSRLNALAARLDAFEVATGGEAAVPRQSPPAALPPPPLVDPAEPAPGS